MACSLQEKLKKLDTLASHINKKEDKVVVGRLSKSPELLDSLKVDFIKTESLKVNNALGGGFPRGKTTIVTGKEDSGKTFILLETIGKNMKEDPNFVAGWLESESSLTEKDLKIFDIDPERFFYLEFDKKSGAETVLDRVEAVLSCSVDFFVINSLKCLVPSTELNGSMSDQQIGLQARMNAKFMRKIGPIVAEQNTAFILVQHLATEIGKMFGDPLVMTGGRAIRYGAVLIVDLRKLSIQDKTDPIKKDEGIKIGLTVVKNHIVTDRFPYVKTFYYGIFGKGTEKYLEAIELAIDEGILAKTGAFIKIPDEDGNPMVINGTKMQWQGTAKFREYCIENPDFFNDLVNKISNKTGFERLTDEEAAEIEELEKQDETLVEEEILDNASSDK